MGITTKKLNYNDLVIELLADLNEREREVVVKRYALNGNAKATLEAIGKAYDITRERVRQIENEGLKKIRAVSVERAPASLRDLEELIADFVARHSFMGQGHLMAQLLHTDETVHATALEFLLEKVIASDRFAKTKHPEFDVIWKRPDIDDTDIAAIGQAIVALIEAREKPISFEELMAICPECVAFPQIDRLPADNHAILEATLYARKDVNKNILQQWGKDNWTTIRPKRMTDKAYLIMLRENRPLHFEECADLINDARFDKKKACAATVHNELILDDKYVLVGRGMYALKEWGFEEGTVSDIIEKILKESGPLTKQELADKVLQQRLVQKTTITLALMNKDRFSKDADGRYALKA